MAFRDSREIKKEECGFVKRSDLVVSNSKDGDLTSFFNIFLKNKMDDVNESGVPEILTINIIKTNNNKVTKDNLLLSVDLPLIPAAYNCSILNNRPPKSAVEAIYDLDAESLFHDFYREGNAEIAKKRALEMDSKILREISDDRAEILFEYLCCKINEKIEELEKLDKKSNNYIYSELAWYLKNLKCMKDYREMTEVKKLDIPTLSSEDKNLIVLSYNSILRYEEKLFTIQLEKEREAEFKKRCAEIESKNKSNKITESAPIKTESEGNVSGSSEFGGE